MRPNRLTPAALLTAVALLVAACGSDGGSAPSDAQVEEAFPCGNAAEPEAPPVTTAPEDETPQPGGSVVYGTEAEVDGYDPANNRWSLSGLQSASAVFDTLTKPGIDGEIYPYLAEDVTSSDDFMTWTITVRPDVFFHNDERLNADAVKQSLDQFRDSVLTGTALSNIDDVVLVDDLHVDVRMIEPWAAFPQYLSSQIGVVAAPEMWRMASEERPRNPIGTGPFVLEEWVPDSSFTTSRYDQYWQDGLPYLDELQFVPLPDPNSRAQALSAGDVDIIHTFTPETIESFRVDALEGKLQVWESCYYGEDEEFSILLNNGAEPFDDKRAREAFAHAVDRDAILESVFNNVFPAATGPFSPSSPWYKEPSAEQAEGLYDPELARQLVDEYKADHGGEFQFELAAPIGIPEALASMQLTQQYLQDVGITVNVATYEFAQYVSKAVVGDYQANIWRQFGATDPDGEYVWWYPGNAKPVGELSLNIGRFQDEQIGEALDIQRQTDDFDVRKEQFDIIQDRFRSEFYVLWSANAFWMVAANNDVRDAVFWTFPDSDQQGMPLSGGQHPVAQIWQADATE